MRSITDERGLSTGGATSEKEGSTSRSGVEPAANQTPAVQQAEPLPSEPFSMPKIHLDAVEEGEGVMPQPTRMQPKSTAMRAKQQIGRGT